MIDLFRVYTFRTINYLYEFNIERYIVLVKLGSLYLSKVYCNYQEINLVAYKVWAMGCCPVSPHLQTNPTM